MTGLIRCEQCYWRVFVRVGAVDKFQGQEALVRLVSMTARDILHGDKRYDSDALRRQIENGGPMPNIPPKANRKWKTCLSLFFDRNSNAIERMFGRLTDFRRLATRYDRSPTNFLATVCITATVSYWL